MSLPWPEGTFLRSRGGQIQGKRDVANDPNAQHVVYETLRRLFDLDFTRVEVAGHVSFGESGAEPLSIEFERDGGELFIAVEGPLSGSVVVFIREGSRASDAVRRDPIAPLKAAWLQASNLNPDYPCRVSVSIDREGAICVSVKPL